MRKGKKDSKEGRRRKKGERRERKGTHLRRSRGRHRGTLKGGTRSRSRRFRAAIGERGGGENGRRGEGTIAIASVGFWAAGGAVF